VRLAARRSGEGWSAAQLAPVTRATNGQNHRCRDRSPRDGQATNRRLLDAILAHEKYRDRREILVVDKRLKRRGNGRPHFRSAPVRYIREAQGARLETPATAASRRRKGEISPSSTGDWGLVEPVSTELGPALSRTGGRQRRRRPSNTATHHRGRAGQGGPLPRRLAAICLKLQAAYPNHG